MPDGPTGRFKAVFISPHLDDAVFACGGTIAQLAQNNAVLVVNVFTHYPASFRKAAINASDQRYEEESNAATFLGYQSVNLGETDAIFRESISGAPGKLFQPPYPDDVARIEALGKRIDELLSRIEYETLYLPMGIGWHVDHLLCHLATRRHLGSANVFMYEDAPYCLIPNATRYRIHELGQPSDPALKLPRRTTLLSDWWETSRAYINTAPVAGIRPYLVRMAARIVVAAYLARLILRHLPHQDPLKPRLEASTYDITEAFDSKVSACYLYRTQVREFFTDRSDCISQYRRYSATMGPAELQFERFWRLVPGPS